MPRREDIHSVLIIGSGPIIIGQACEFDYSGTQAVKVLRKEGLRVILLNSNPATIMTDPEMADATYLEPLTPEMLERVIAREKPDAVLPTLGGQTGLNLAVALAERGILEKYGVRLIGASQEAIRRAEDRRLFKKTMEDIGLDLPRSGFAYNLEEARTIAQTIGFPLIIRPSFTLGGTGSHLVYTQDEFLQAAADGLAISPIGEILIEESVIGWKELELEVMRDRADNCVVICSIENFDPMGVHTGDSITVAPAQTLSDSEYQKMRNAAFACIRAIGVDTGGSNIQFAFHPETGRMVIIEMNPRVSRSSALASKATGFPIAKIAALLAIGYRLDEIPNDITEKTPASFEPSIDYVVVKIPRFTFEKFPGSDNTLNTAMKSVGEVMALGRTFKEAIQKSIRGLEIGRWGLLGDGNGTEEEFLARLAAGEKIENLREKLFSRLSIPNAERIFYLPLAFQLGFSLEEINKITMIDSWFLYQIKEIVEMAEEIKARTKQDVKKLFNDADFLFRVKSFGFSDYQLAHLAGLEEEDVRRQRALALKPTYKLVDTCAAEFPAVTPYFYSTYETEDEARVTARPKVIILGGGPNRIGQGIEFDYCCVHSVFALKEMGYEAIMINCNPETVSTDYDTADRLYFEPLTLEDVLHIVEREGWPGVIVQFGGQTPLNLALALERAAVHILGTSPDSIDKAEDRERFGELLINLDIPRPEHGVAFSFADARSVAERIGYPLMVRPSYVLGGRAMEIVYDEEGLAHYIRYATAVSPEHPVLIDRFLENAVEIDVDAVADTEEVFIGGIMEHIEEAGIHSGDSACMLPPRTLKPGEIEKIMEHTRRLAIALEVKGLINIQFAVKDGIVYVLEVNPRASRTVPFVSKTTGIPLAKVATRIMLGEKLSQVLPAGNFPRSAIRPRGYVAVKEAVLPWNRFPGVDAILGPEMHSTGEVMGIDFDFGRAFAKSQTAAGTVLPDRGKILLSLRRQDKEAFFSIAETLVKRGFVLVATEGTAEYFIQRGLSVEKVKKISEGRPNVVDLIRNREVRLVINTPSGKRSRSDGYAIRQAALLSNLPIITTVAAARAAIEGIIASQERSWEVQPIQEYYKSQREISRDLG